MAHSVVGSNEVPSAYGILVRESGALRLTSGAVEKNSDPSLTGSSGALAEQSVIPKVLASTLVSSVEEEDSPNGVNVGSGEGSRSVFGRDDDTESKSPLDDVVRVMNDYMQSVQRDLRFSLDEKTGRSVIKVLDTQSDEVIRQIPPEEVLRMAWRLQTLGELGSVGFVAQA